MFVVQFLRQVSDLHRHRLLDPLRREVDGCRRVSWLRENEMKHTHSSSVTVTFGGPADLYIGKLERVVMFNMETLTLDIKLLLI